MTISLPPPPSNDYIYNHHNFIYNPHNFISLFMNITTMTFNHPDYIYNQNYYIFNESIRYSGKHVKSPLDGHKPLSLPMMTLFTDAYICANELNKHIV